MGRGDLREQEAHAASCAEISCLNSPGLVSFLEESMDVWEADPEEAGCFQAACCSKGLTAPDERGPAEQAECPFQGCRVP